MKVKNYKYLGYTYPNVSPSWKPIIIDMLSKMDKEIRPWYIPRFLMNFINWLATGNSIIRVENWFWYDIISKLKKDNHITDIKDKYAGLRVYGSFSKEVENIVYWAEKECNETCEKCGSKKDVHICNKNQGGWLYNYCSECRDATETKYIFTKTRTKYD